MKASLDGDLDSDFNLFGRLSLSIITVHCNLCLLVNKILTRFLVLVVTLIFIFDFDKAALKHG